MSDKKNNRNKRLEIAMKQNILRRKELDNDINSLNDKITDFKKTQEPIFEKKNNYNKEFFLVITDLISGGLAGLIIGFGIMKYFNIINYIPLIICFAFGILGGLYNISKRV